MARCKRMGVEFRFASGALVWACMIMGCVTTAEPVEPETPKVIAATGTPVQFSYVTLDGQMLSTSTVAGRYTVLAFITTYDQVYSHAQARFLSTVVNKHVPRINAGAIVLEPEENRVLVEAFVKVVAPPYPVAMANEATIRGEGPFQDLREVPTIVILDQLGREVWRHRGLATNDLINAALDALRKGKTPP